MEVTEERFRALARSSPWRWETLRFTLVRRPSFTPGFEAGLRAWVRRPDAVRVEDLDGNLVQVVHEEVRTVGLLTPEGGSTVPLQAPSSTVPARDEDGFVVERPWLVDYDAPMFHDYHWVAMLDPVELGDGDGGHPGTLVRDVREVDHHGRPAWEAVLEPTEAYEPRCSCCALLFSAASELRMQDEGGPAGSSHEPGWRYADRHLVRVDVETGVCVYAEEQGGSRDGQYHLVRIEAVDGPMPDDLFPPTPLPDSRFFRRSRR